MTWRVSLDARMLAVRACVIVPALLATALTVALARGGQLPATHAPVPPAPTSSAASDLPMSARGPISSIVGADTRAYRVRSLRGGTLEAANRAQRLRALFTAAGVQLRSRGLHVGLALREFGYKGALGEVERAAPKRNSNRVLYARTKLEEWYANGPLGLEQGFTIGRPPAARARGTLTLALRISGPVQIRLAADSRSVTLARAGGPALRYGDLLATDASGRSLHSRLAVSGRRVLLEVDAREARYPIRIDPLVQNGDKIVAGESSEGSMVGYSLAMSADGNTALVGAPGDDNGAGAAWILVRSGGGWVQQGAKLVSDEAPESGEEPCNEEEGEVEACHFATSVAISADGNTALIGAPRATAPCRRPGGVCRYQGAAFVFTRSGSTWSLGAVLTGGIEEAPEARFGRSVALSGDGATALVGAPAISGAAFVFVRSGSSWAKQGPSLTAPGAVGEAHFGVSVALSGDGSTALVGGPGDNDHQGAAWLFERSGSSWTQAGAKLTGQGEIGKGRFAFRVALSGDGSTALVGAPQDNENEGAAWVFVRSSSSWLQQGEKLTDQEEAKRAAFGSSVALSSDGNTALIGAPHDSGEGAAWLLARSGGRWTRREKLTGLESSGAPLRADSFGRSVALRGDAATALIGAPGDGGKRGALWAFAEPALLPSVAGVEPAAGPVAGGTVVTITGERLADAIAVTFESFERTQRSEPAPSFTVNSSGSITAVSPEAPGGAAETVYVRVTTREGASPLGSGARFTYTGGTQPSGGPSSAGLAFGEQPLSSVAAPAPSSAVLGFSPDCSLSLLSRNARVLAHGRVGVRLLARGSGTCSGKLTLRARIKHGRRLRLRTIGAAAFKLAVGRARTATVKLNALGRALLRRGHGRMSANLLVVNLAPGAVRVRSVNLRLAVSAPHVSVKR